MTVSLYSVLAAILWFSFLILLAACIQRRTELLLYCRPTALLLLAALAVIRLTAPVETPYTQEVALTALYPPVRDFLRGPLFALADVSVSGSALFLGIWAAGAVVLCVRLCLQLCRDSRDIRRLCPMPCRHAEQCLGRSLARSGGVRRVGLLVSPDVQMPVSVGFVHPKILLPQECGDLTAEELGHVMIHELSHLKNRDLWVKLLTRLICCLMWWNPCAYLLKRDLDAVLEYRCDLAATRNMGARERVAYLQTLLNSMKRVKGSCPESVAMRSGFCEAMDAAVVKRRFQLVLSRRERRKKLPAAISIIAAFALFAASYSFVLQPASYPPSQDLMGEIAITSENAYILALADGTYELVLEGERLQKLPVDVLGVRPYCNLTIQEDAGEGLK